MRLCQTVQGLAGNKPMRNLTFEFHAAIAMLRHGVSSANPEEQSILKNRNICNCWTEMPDCFGLNPLHHTAGLNT